MPQITLRFKIHQDGKVEETVEGIFGDACNDATKNLESSLGFVKVKNKTIDAFMPNHFEDQKNLTNESNVSL